VIVIVLAAHSHTFFRFKNFFYYRLYASKTMHFQSLSELVWCGNNSSSPSGPEKPYASPSDKKPKKGAWKKEVLVIAIVDLANPSDL